MNEEQKRKEYLRRLRRKTGIGIQKVANSELLKLYEETFTGQIIRLGIEIESFLDILISEIKHSK